MRTANCIGRKELIGAGFTVHAVWAHRWFKVTAPDGTEGHVLRQGKNCWHFFNDNPGWTASGTSVDSCLRGGLGDALHTDAHVKAYERLLHECPVAVRRACLGIR